MMSKPLFTSTVLSMLICLTASAQTSPAKRQLSEGYYVVIGAYSVNKESYAQHYINTLAADGHEAAYGLNERGSLYFVYLHATQNYKEALNKMRETRQQSAFSDAWVYVKSTPAPADARVELAQQTDEVAPAASPLEPEEEGVQAVDEDETETPEDVAEDIDEVSANATEKHEEEGLSNIIVDENEAEDQEEEGKMEDLGDVSVFVNMFNARNLDDISGEVQIIDAERSKFMSAQPAGDYIRLPDPNNGTGNLLLIADVFGFRKSQHMLNYYSPFQDTTKQYIDMIADTYVVNFDLVRYHKGDIVVMYNVYFFNDAAIMRPESQYEINSLLSMLEENPDYKIRIHGHVNGRNPGKLISKAEEADNFFALSETDKHGYGSAKELSKKRAELIRDYLVANGIAPERLEIKAWGGKRMLYDKLSTRANENVRVEIEILDE